MRIQVGRSIQWQIYELDLPESAFILDALEEIQKNDPTFLFRHSCHHGSCGSCGIRINGRERLACTTQISDVLCEGNSIVIEPLRNFPLLGDLLVDHSSMFVNLDAAGSPCLKTSESSPSIEHPFFRFQECIECGLCISACPISGSNPEFIGPVVMAAVLNSYENHQILSSNQISLIDNEHGIWRCHSAFECSEVCPAQVDPARAIITLRQVLFRARDQHDSD